jgi:integrase
VRFGDAIDRYIGDLARRGRRPSTLASYRRLLNDFADQLRAEDVHELALSDYERFLDRWVGAAPSTLASGVSLVKGFSRFLFERGLTPADVAYPLKRPPKPRPEDLEVVTVSGQDVRRLLDACLDWQEFLCIATAVYLGPRRRALALVRRSEVDLIKGTIRFVEKGGKVAVKPLPDEYRQILLAAEDDGVWNGPGDYLIPNRRPAAVRRRVERSDKVIWDTVKTMAARAGVRTHVHALRAAFAVQFEEAHPDQLGALKDLMGHARLETTLSHYLRRRDKARAMETVRDLTWGSSVFPSNAQEAHTGFEPVPPP